MKWMYNKLINCMLFMLLTYPLGYSQSGTSCNDAITALADTNMTDNSNGDKWYKYTVQQSGKALRISTCGLTSEITYVELYKGNCSGMLQLVGSALWNCDSQSQLYTSVDSGVTYYIYWRDDYTQSSFYWTLEEVTPSPGEICGSAIPALADTNIADNTNGNQWFKYKVQNKNKILKISTCGLTSEKTYFDLYKGSCNNLIWVSSGLMNCGDQSFVRTKADSGVTYYILWRNAFTQNSYPWTLEELDPEPGEICDVAIVAVADTNIADNSKGDQWFKYTANATGNVLKISTCNLTTEMTFVELYKGSCDSLQYLGFSSFSCGNQSRLIYQVDSGTTYYIRWRDYYTSSSYPWTLEEVAPTAGEVCLTAIPAIQDTNFADNSNGDQWFKYTAQKTGNIIKISTCGLTSETTLVELYKGNCNNLQLISSGSWNCSTQSRIVTKVDSGTTYYIRWRNTFTQQSYPWILKETPPQPGEICSTAILAQIDTNFTNNSNGDQWFKYTVRERNKAIKISTCGLTSATTFVELYKGNCDTLQFLSHAIANCGSQSRLIFPVDSGVTYYIKWNEKYTSSSYPWTLQLISNGGISCEHAITANIGVNTADHSNVGSLWFKYTATSSKKLTINTCDITTIKSNLNVFKGTCSSLTYISLTNDCFPLVNVSLVVDSGATYYFRWNNTNNEIYPWMLIFNEKPDITTVSGPNAICTNIDSIVYTIDSSYNATDYVWLLPGGVKDTIKTNTYTLFTNTINSDSITIGVYALNLFGTSDTAYITTRLIQTPEKPTITRSGNTLTSSAANGNQWYNLAGAISGAVNNTYTVTQDGQYYVVVNNNGCLSEPSDTITVTLTGIVQETVKGGIQIYPNPVGNKLYIQSDFGDGIIINYEIYNTAGTRIMSGKFTGNTSIDVTKLTRGVYSLHLSSEKGISYSKFIKK